MQAPIASIRRMPAALIAMTNSTRHTLFWACVALLIVGVFLAIAGILRVKLSVIDRGWRLLTAIGLTLVVVGALAAAWLVVGAPGSTVAVLKEMVGSGEAVAPSPPPPPKPGTETVDVSGVDFKFEPSTITIASDEPVEVRFVNDGQNPHTFTLQDEGFEVKADPGQTASGEIPPLKPGAYEFICSIPGHAQLGMTGKLVVEKRASGG